VNVFCFALAGADGFLLCTPDDSLDKYANNPGDLIAILPGILFVTNNNPDRFLVYPFATPVYGAVCNLNLCNISDSFETGEINFHKIHNAS
jgi:hypothetical protein